MSLTKEGRQAVEDYIRTVQELLGHKDLKTTMVYMHVLNRGAKAVRSPLDLTMSEISSE